MLVEHFSLKILTYGPIVAVAMLTRFEQRLLIKLFGGGTARKENPAVVDELRARGFVDENDELALPGLFILTLAMRRQQAEALVRSGLAA